MVQGAWMKKHRDDGAVRRKGKKENAAVKPAEAEVKPAPIDQSIREEAAVEEEGGVY